MVYVARYRVMIEGELDGWILQDAVTLAQAFQRATCGCVHSR